MLNESAYSFENRKPNFYIKICNCYIKNALGEFSSIFHKELPGKNPIKTRGKIKIFHFMQN